MGFLNIQPWGNKRLNNGHVEGGTEQASIWAAINLFDLDSYRTRWWFHGGGTLFPCDCPLSGYGPPDHRIDDIEFRHEYKPTFVPTAGVPSAAINISNRGLVDYNTPTFADSIFPGGDALQWQLYENLNSYWFSGVP